MNVTAVLAEIVIIGITANLGILFIMLGFGGNVPLSSILPLIKDLSAILLVFFIGFSYFTGNLINTLSHFIFDFIDKGIRLDVLEHVLAGDSKEDKNKHYQQIRLKIYKASDELKSFLDVRYSIIRLFRSSVVSFLILGIGFIIWRPAGFATTQLGIIIGFLIVFILSSFLAFINQTRGFYGIIANIEENVL